jgi:K+-transporting ATPase ATPase A chain
MSINGWSQIALFALIIILLVKPLGTYMTNVFEGERTILSSLLRPIEHGIYRLCGVDERAEQHWTVYGFALLVFSFFGFLTLYGLQRLQALLPFNPQALEGVTPDLAFNTSISFITNTNWQSYVPEATYSYLVEMAGLTVHNFLSAAAGIALAIALIRGFARHSSGTIGNFWVDMTRAVLYILLPLSIIGALVLVWQGVPQNLDGYTVATTLEGHQQTIAQGPVASQEVIKMMGTNGGGFFNANSAHPYENPNAVTNLIEMVLIFAIAAALTNVFGRMVGKAGRSSRSWGSYFWPASPRLTGRKAPPTQPSPRSPSMPAAMPCRLAAIWKAKRFASALPTRRFLRPRPRMRPVAPSIRCMTA